MSALARWEGFLAQIAERHRGVRTEAEAAARAFVASIAGGGDYQPLSNQLTAVSSRLQELATMISDTWHAKVEDAIFAEGGTVADRDREWARGEHLRYQLEDEREALEPRIFAHLARERFARALAAYPGGVACARCGARLEVGVTFRAMELACWCGAKTSFEPGPAMRTVAAIGAHAIAQEAAHAEWLALRTAERALRFERSPHSLGVIVAIERAQITYWRAYLAVRSQLEPELARDPAKEVRMRMEQWYTAFAEHERAWVDAGRPRAI